MDFQRHKNPLNSLDIGMGSKIERNFMKIIEKYNNFFPGKKDINYIMDEINSFMVSNNLEILKSTKVLNREEFLKLGIIDLGFKLGEQKYNLTVKIK